MDAATARALLAINRRFYARHAVRFSGSRRHPWPGWSRLLAHLEPSADPLAVLDAGCGNGRFARYLVRAWPGPVDYLGLDHSPELLARADDETRRVRDERPPGGGSRLCFASCDLLAAGALERATAGREHHLAVLFGVLHHVPGRARRRRLLERLAAALAPGGLLAVTVWRFDADPRFERQRVPWREYAEIAGEPIDRARLEPGDHLLSFDGDRGHPRYCHALSSDELEGLIRDLGLDLVDRYDADGHSGDRNRYRVWRR